MVWNFFTTGHARGEVDGIGVLLHEKFKRNKSSPKERNCKMRSRL
jgi:hypothetical protein